MACALRWCSGSCWGWRRRWASAADSSGGGNTGGGNNGGSGGTDPSSSSSTGGTTNPSSSSSGAGGSGGYGTCGECTDSTPAAGAKSKECKTQGDACFQNKNCVQIYNCVYFGGVDKDGNSIGLCETSAAGACCTFQCYQAIKDITGDPTAAQQAIDAYEALDQCLTCQVCKSLCTGADEYCAKYAMGASSCP
ncbi:MAG: hypothetical protein QM820_37450 [Minicystis sp.]